MGSKESKKDKTSLNINTGDQSLNPIDSTNEKTKISENKSDDLYQQFFEIGNTAKIIFTAQGLILKSNPYFYQLLKDAKKSTTNLFPCLGPSSIDKIKAYLELATSTNAKPRQIPLQLIQTDSNVVEIICSVCVMEKDEAHCVFVADLIEMPDNTNQQEEQALKTIHQLSKSGNWFWSKSENRIIWSKEIFKLYEIENTSKHFDFQSTYELVHPNDREKLRSILEIELFEEQQMEYVYRIIVSDGSTKYFKLKAITNNSSHEGSKEMAGTLTDITDELIKVKQSKKEEQLYTKLFEDFSDVFILFELKFDASGNIIDYVFKNVNRYFEIQFDLKKELIIGENLSGQLPSIFEQMHSLFRITAIAQQSQQDRLYIAHLDGFYDVIIFSPEPNLLATAWRDVSLIVEADSALRESEEKYRQIFSIGSEAIFMIDFASGAILDVNPLACSLLKTNKEAILKQNFEDFSADAESLKKEIRNQAKSLINHIFVNKDGNQFPVEISISFFNWAGRKVYVANVTDITERLSAQERIIKSEQKFKQLFDLSNDAILLIKNYRIVDFNKKATDLFGLSSDELLNKTLWNLSPTVQKNGADSRLEIVEHLQSSLMGKNLSLEWIFKNADGNNFYSYLSLAPIIYGSYKVSQAIIRDNTLAKQKEINLIKSEERWKYALEGNINGVWDWNLITNDIYFSAVWKKILGYAENEIVNEFEEFEKRIHPEDVSLVYNNIDWYLTAKIPVFAIEFRLHCKNGTYKWILGRGKIVAYNDDGKPNRFVGTMEDITRNKLHEQELILEKEKLLNATVISKLGHWNLDLKTMVFSGSPSAFTIFGLSVSQSLSLKLLEQTIHPDDREKFRNQFISNKELEKKQHLFRVIVGNKTKYVQANAFPDFDNNNILIGFNGVFQDVTIFQLETINLKEKSELLENITEHSSFSLMLVYNNKIVYSNQHFSKLTGYSENEIQNKELKFEVLFSEKELGPIQLLLTNVSSEKAKIEKKQLEIKTKNNRSKWVELQISSSSYENNPAFLFTFQDITKRISKEQKQADEQHRFIHIANEAPIAVTMLDRTGNFIYANKSFMQLVHCNEADIQKMNLQQLLQGDMKHEILESFKNLGIANNASMNSIVPIRCTKEVNKWVQLLGHNPNNNAKSDYINLFFLDIDKDKRAKEKLEFNSQLFQSIHETTKDAVAVYEASNVALVYNHAYVRWFRELNLEIHRIKFSELPFHKDYEYHWVKESGVESHKQVSFDFKVKNDQIYTISVHPIQVNSIEYFIVRVKDVTSIRSTLKNLKSKYETFFAIFQHAALGISMIDKSRRIIQCNQRYAELLGYTPEELEDKKIDELIYTEQITETITGYSQLFTGIKDHFTRTKQLICKNGTSVWVISHSTSIKNVHGDIYMAATIIEDITQKKADEQKILNDERIKTIHQLAKTTAHEFNNLLMGIYGNSFILQNKLDNSELQGYCDNIITAVNRSKKLTQKLLSFAWNDKQLSMVTDVLQLINNLCTDNKEASSKNVHIHTNFPGNAVNTIGDPVMLQNAIQNIMDNAIEASSRDSEINIELSVVYFEEDILTQKQIKPGKYARIKISDSGKGINENDKDKIFDAFFTTKTNTLNAGLGLTVAFEIIKAHKGTISFTSSKNEGTAFTIYVPVTEKIPDNKVFPEEMEISGNANILIVDDEDIVRSITVELLKKLGYNVFSFSEGQHAIKFYQENFHLIDLAILDLHMPEMRGDELYEKLKAINMDVKTILLSGFGMDENIEAILTEGVLAFVQKPVSIEKLSNVISVVLNN